jgi:hypothetical protein
MQNTQNMNGANAQNESGQTAEAFYNWAYKGRGKSVKNMLDGVKVPQSEFFFNFTAHTPTFVSYGSKGLNASVKGVGWIPKKDLMPKILDEYLRHINSYAPDDKTYQSRGLEILYRNLYCDEAAGNVDFTVLSSVEMAFVHSYYNYSENPEATLLFYQPPAISYELRGKMSLHGKRYEKDAQVDIRDLDLYQQFVNAQHDMYHSPNTAIWKTRPVYLFKIEEMFNNGLGPQGFGRGHFSLSKPVTKSTDIFL